MQVNESPVVSLYVVREANGTFFAGFDPVAGKASFVNDPTQAKKFTNKYEIKLRPEEMIVELSVSLTPETVKVSEPFRPVRRTLKATPK